ncbi:hypothetical protein B1H29_09045 [Streptomyces pactum]|uniref:Polynucleotide kinase-phosphatase ligase domain-containing protein n=1 Tax=Streptomyces pactum TaxID=68249 RepID=A0A1S6J5K5_9ACTN|nr:hypothetical protein [Streptomyces pactum]AQS67049.1 hypothetical protein B1H29_09045 [Streptomyces pactum]
MNSHRPEAASPWASCWPGLPRRRDVSEAILDRLRTAIGEAGLWDELATDWLLLDAELMPWSLKASGLLRSQYAAVGAASGAVFPGALAALEGAGARGVDVTGLLEHQRARSAAAFTDATAGTAGAPTAWTASAHEAVFGVLALEPEPVDPRL